MNDSWEVIEADGSKAIYGNGGLSTRATWKAVDYSYPMYIPTGKQFEFKRFQLYSMTVIVCSLLMNSFVIRKISKHST